jgi:hypothetical protein
MNPGDLLVLKNYLWCLLQLRMRKFHCELSESEED